MTELQLPEAVLVMLGNMTELQLPASTGNAGNFSSGIYGGSAWSCFVSAFNGDGCLNKCITVHKKILLHEFE